MKSARNDSLELKNFKANNDSNTPSKQIYFGKRFLVAFLVWFGLFLNFGGKFNHFLAHAIHYVIPGIKKIDYGVLNYDDPNSDKYFGNDVGFAFACGFVLTGIPGGYLSYRFQANRVFFVSVIISCFINVFVPVVIQSKGALIALYLFQGLAEGMLLPAFFGIWSNWSPQKSINLLIPISYSGLFLGLLTSGGLTYEFLHDWVYPYYIFGGMAVIWLTIWLWLVYESPAKHPTINEEELKLFSNVRPRKDDRIPWKRMLTSLPMWSIMIGSLCQILLFANAVHDEATNHLKIAQMVKNPQEYFGNDPEEEIKYFFIYNFYIPHTIALILILFASCLTFYLNNRKGVPTVRIRKGFTCFGFKTATIYWMLAQFVPGMFVLAIIGFCLPLCGVFLNPMDIAPQYAAIIVGISNTFGAFVTLLIPNLLRMTFVIHSMYDMFILAAVVTFVGSGFYAIFASDEKQRWDE